jgi:hypothetical protein
MAQGFWLKTIVGSTWSKITNFYVKTSTAGWAQVQDAWIKTTTGGWTKFFSALMAPSQQVELDYQYGGYDSETLQIRGKNYVWSPTPQSLKYYFRAVNEDGTTYVGSGGSSGATAQNTVSYYPGTSTYLSINPSDYNYKVGGLTKYFFEVRATGASGTVYSSLSNDVYAEVASPLAPTLSIQSSTSTSVTVRVTAASDTTGTWGFSSWAATYRYIVYTYDSVGGTIYTGGGRGGIGATSSAQDITLTGLTAGRSYYIYVLPVTGTVGTRPFPYNASSQTNGYSGYPGVEAYILFQTASPPTNTSSPYFTLQSGTANTVNSVYRLNSGTWDGSPTEYRYEIGRNDPAGTVIATFPSTTTWTTQTYYDHTFTSTTAGYSVYGSVIAKNANGQSVPATASSSIGPIIASPQSTGQYRRVTMPIAFASSQTVWVGTNGYVSTTVDPTTSPGTSWPSAGGVVVGPFVADLVQTSLSYKADGSNFWIKWSGYRLNDTSKTCSYLMKFYWNSTTVDVYFITNNLTDASTDAIRYGGSQYQTWADSTSISAFSEPSGMIPDSTNNGVDDNRTVLTAASLTAPTISASVSPTTGTAGTTTYYASSTTTGNPAPTVTYSWQYFLNGGYYWVQYTTGTQFSPASNINTSVNALAWQMVATATNSQGSATSTVSITINNPSLSKLDPPTGLSATTTRTDGINISWNPVTGAAYYGVWYRGGAPSYDSPPDFGGPNSAGGWSGVGTSYLDTSIGAGVTRSYDVQAYRSGNPTGTKSEWAGPVTGTRASATVSPPSTPTGVGLTGSGSVSWTASSGATSYEIEFYTASNGSGSNAAGPYYVTGISSSPYQLTSPYGGTNANWARVRVLARNSGGASAYSGWVPSATSYT